MRTKEEGGKEREARPGGEKCSGQRDPPLWRAAILDYLVRGLGTGPTRRGGIGGGQSMSSVVAEAAITAGASGAIEGEAWKAASGSEVVIRPWLEAGVKLRGSAAAVAPCSLVELLPVLLPLVLLVTAPVEVRSQLMFV